MDKRARNLPRMIVASSESDPRIETEIEHENNGKAADLGLDRDRG
jgi:hypothetical protein